MKIAITGTLEGYSKDEAARRMAAVGATHSDNVTQSTHYLVVAKLGRSASDRMSQTKGSTKIKDAIRFKVRTLTQAEFEDYVEAGGFPAYERADPTPRVPPRVPWDALPKSEQYSMAMTYHDEFGEISERTVIVIATGELTCQAGVRRYLQAIDKSVGSFPRTFREDRILDGRRL